MRRAERGVQTEDAEPTHDGREHAQRQARQLQRRPS
jgi:hypothetical protein